MSKELNDELRDDFEPLTLADEAEIWQLRTHQLWETATANGDTRSQCAALSSAFRSLQQRAKQAETRESEVLPASPWDWPAKDGERMRAWLDRLVQNVEAAEESE
jgi:hypothetical protein